MPRLMPTQVRMDASAAPPAGQSLAGRHVQRDDDLVGDAKRASEFEFERQLAKLGKPVAECHALVVPTAQWGHPMCGPTSVQGLLAAEVAQVLASYGARPWQVEHSVVNASSSPVPIFFRVICTSPRLVTSAT